MLLVWAAVTMGAVTVSPSSSSSQGVVGDGTSVGTGISVGERCCPEAIAEEPNAEEPSMPDSTAPLACAPTALWATAAPLALAARWATVLPRMKTCRPSTSTPEGGPSPQGSLLAPPGGRPMMLAMAFPLAQAPPSPWESAVSAPTSGCLFSEAPAATTHGEDISADSGIGGGKAASGGASSMSAVGAVGGGAVVISRSSAVGMGSDDTADVGDGSSVGTGMSVGERG
eukprot:s3987_g1.t1